MRLQSQQSKVGESASGVDLVLPGGLQLLLSPTLTEGWLIQPRLGSTRGETEPHRATEQSFITASEVQREQPENAEINR